MTFIWKHEIVCLNKKNRELIYANWLAVKYLRLISLNIKFKNKRRQIS